jgi:hypothetical protein
MVMDDDDIVPPGRDAKGRWVKGTCGNPKGRPRKHKFNTSGAYYFSKTLVEVTIEGQKRVMTRQEFTLYKAFEAAAKGSIHAIKFLDQKFEQLDLVRHKLSLDLEDMNRYYQANPDKAVPHNIARVAYRIHQMLYQHLAEEERPSPPYVVSSYLERNGHLDQLMADEQEDEEEEPIAEWRRRIREKNKRR